MPAIDEDRFRAFVIASFGLRRKQMRRVVRTVAGSLIATQSATA